MEGVQTTAGSDLEDTVDVTIPIATDVAAVFSNPYARQAIGHIVSRMLRPGTDTDPLLAAMDRLGAEAKRRGLTPEILEEELAAYNAERREHVA